MSVSPHVPKFGEWDVDGESGGQQAFTLIFDNMRADKSMKRINPNDPAFLADFLNSSSTASSSSSQAAHAVHDVDQLPPTSSLHESPQPPLQPTPRLSVNYKNVIAPKFGNWDVENPKEYTTIFDELKEEKRQRHNPITNNGAQKRTSTATQFTTHKPSLLKWRLCFNSGHAVRD